MSSTLAIYGGTFDPVHLGHLRAAQEVLEELALEKIFFMPCAEPPFCKNLPTSDTIIRLEMLRLAIKDNPRFSLIDLEIKRGGKNYTIDTLEELKRKKPKDRLVFLAGADTFYSIHSWRQPRRLFNVADFLIITRQNTSNPNLLEYLKQHLDPSFTLTKEGWIRLPNGYGAKQITTTLLNISSSDLKKRAAQGLSLTYLVPPSVEKYINVMKLYTNRGPLP